MSHHITIEFTLLKELPSWWILRLNMNWWHLSQCSFMHRISLLLLFRNILILNLYSKTIECFDSPGWYWLTSPLKPLVSSKPHWVWTLLRSCGRSWRFIVEMKMISVKDKYPKGKVKLNLSKRWLYERKSWLIIKC